MKFNNIWGKRKVNNWADGLIIISIILCIASLANSEAMAKRFEYKLSFKGPYMVLNNGTVPFWEHQGSAIASDESVRITPSLRSKKGSIWSRELNQFKNWEIEVTFRISGRGRVGADGLAVWYTTERGVEGPVFGSKDQWNGLGVFFDSFDNDNKHNNPHIMAMVNDGTQTYDHEVDGSNQQLGGCLRDFRNRPHPTKVKVEYFMNTLSISFNNGLTEDAENYDLCLKVENVNLPPSGYFGVSAATGGLADDHDVLSFITNSLHPQIMSEDESKKMELDMKKYEKEYQDFVAKMSEAREEYKKEHPKSVSEIEVDENSIYEGQEARELRQIFEGQQVISATIRSTMNLLNEIVARQEKHSLSLAEMSQKFKQPASADNTGSQNDIEQVMRAQTLFSGDIKELKDYVNELGNKLSSITSQEASKNERLVRTLQSTMQEEVKLLSKQLGFLQSHISASQKSTSCVTLTHLVLFLFLHLTVIISYLYYKARKEAAAKKLF